MRSSLALALLVVLGGCALPQQQSRTPSPYQPLEAYITALTPGGPLFHVNRPAYVAMFYISPGSGVSMLYPGFGSGGSLSARAFAGSHFASTRMNNRSQYIFTRASVLQPRFYFLIASEQPLNVSQFGSFGDGLRSRLGTAFASYSAFDTMEEIAQLALPSLSDDGSWTSDMYVEWPDVIYSEPGGARMLVQCAGYSMWVAREHVALVRASVCEAIERHEPKEPAKPGDDDGREPIDERDEGGEPVRSTTRSALAAASGRGADRSMSTSLRERISASTQLSAAAVNDAPWANAFSTPRSGTTRDGYMPPRTYDPGMRSPSGAARVAPAGTRAPAATSTTAGGARATEAPSTGSTSSGGGDSGGRSRPTPSN